MASSRSWPFDDDDRPSGSVRPLSQADLQAILAHLGDDPDQLLAGTGAGRKRDHCDRADGDQGERWAALPSPQHGPDGTKGLARMRRSQICNFGNFVASIAVATVRRPC